MLIAVDWGTTRLRAYLMVDGDVVDTIASDKGLMAVDGGSYGSVLASAIGPWRESAPDAPILMSGMVGSRQGWVEVPYVPLPASIDDLAAATLPIDAPGLGSVAIVPGIAAGMDGSTWGDVMRGEETEVFGALADRGDGAALFVMPGSHSKWVECDGGMICSFRTFMTGELFAAISAHTILSKMMDAGRDDDAAFAAGVQAAGSLAAPGDLMSRLFSIRAETLFGRLAPDAAGAFLSGLLIGAEIKSAAAGARDVIVVGAEKLAQRYAAALAIEGIGASASPPAAAARGLNAIAGRRNLLP